MLIYSRAMSFGERFTQSLQKSGMSKRELARRLGKSPGNIGNWERGDAEPGSLELIQQIANELGVSAGWLAFGETAAKATLEASVPEAVVSAVIKAHKDGRQLHDDKTLQIVLREFLSVLSDVYPNFSRQHDDTNDIADLADIVSGATALGFRIDQNEEIVEGVVREQIDIGLSRFLKARGLL